MALGLHKVHIRGFQSGVGLVRGLRSGRQLLVFTLRVADKLLGIVSIGPRLGVGPAAGAPVR